MLQFERRSDILVVLSKAVVAVLLLGLLIYNIGSANIVSAFKDADWSALPLVFALLLMQGLASAVRWFMLMHRLGAPQEKLTSVFIYLVSGIASLVLVTSIAGISVRIALHCRLGASLISGVLASFLEKFSGLVAMALSVFVLVFVKENRDLSALAFDRLAGSGPNLTFPVLPIYLVGAIAVMAGAVALLVVLRKTGTMERLRTRLRQRLEYFRELASMLKEPAFILPLLAVSLIIFLFGGFAIISVAQAFSQPLPAQVFFFIYPAIAIVSALPISVSGWGVREGAMVLALGPLGVAPEQALAISVSYGLAGMFATAILGALSYMMLLPKWGALIGSGDNRDAQE